MDCNFCHKIGLDYDSLVFESWEAIMYINHSQYVLQFRCSARLRCNIMKDAHSCFGLFNDLAGRAGHQFKYPGAHLSSVSLSMSVLVLCGVVL